MLFQRVLSLSFLLFFLQIFLEPKDGGHVIYTELGRSTFFLVFSSLFFLCPFLSDFSDAYGRESADLVE